MVNDESFKLTPIPEEPPDPPDSVLIKTPEPPPYLINKKPDLPIDDLSNLTPPEEQPVQLADGQPTITAPVSITTMPLKKMQQPRQGLSKAVPPGQIRIGI